MSEISRPAGERIKRAVRKIERLNTPPPPGVQPANSPILLVRAQENIDTGSTGMVKRVVRQNSDDDKGDEVEIGDEFEVFCRFSGLSDNQEALIRWIDGGWEALGGSASLTILGPCAAYTPAVELDDSDFDVDFGGDCDGPSRFGLFLRNLQTNITSTINLERTTGLNYESSSFSYSCASSTKTLTAELDFTGLDVDDAVLTFYESATPITIYKNSIYRFFPLVGSYLQVQTSPCDCVTFPYDVCIAPPTR